MVMDPCRSEIIPRDRRAGILNNGAVAMLGLLLLWICTALMPETATATTIYSYIDDQGTPVLTDNFERIPERYRAKVQVTEQAGNHASDPSVGGKIEKKIADLASNNMRVFNTFVPNISGLTHYQSQVLTFGGIGAVACLLARLFMRGQVVRFLTLWCLIMLGLTVPALFFTSRDAPLDRIIGQAGEIQEKQQKHLPGTL